MKQVEEIQIETKLREQLEQVNKLTGNKREKCVNQINELVQAYVKTTPKSDYAEVYKKSNLLADLYKRTGYTDGTINSVTRIICNMLGEEIQDQILHIVDHMPQETKSIKKHQEEM